MWRRSQVKSSQVKWHDINGHVILVAYDRTSAKETKHLRWLFNNSLQLRFKLTLLEFKSWNYDVSLLQQLN